MHIPKRAAGLGCNAVQLLTTGQLQVSRYGTWIHVQLHVYPAMQVHLGYFATEVAAARAHDLAAVTKKAKQGINVVSSLTPASYRYVHDSTLLRSPIVCCRLHRASCHLRLLLETLNCMLVRRHVAVIGAVPM